MSNREELTEKEKYAQELTAYALGERPDCPKKPTPSDNAGRRVLPCPFCGGPAKVHRQFDGLRKVRGYYVCCNTKGCAVFASTRVKREKGVVIDEWNTRKGKDNEL